MASPASIAKHPIHPMLIVFPIGLWVFSFVCDVVFFMGWGGLVWSEVAFYTMAGGVVGALLAAIPGLIDFLSIPSSQQPMKRLGWYHLIINLSVVVLYALNLWWRVGSAPGAGGPMALGLLGVVLLAISGWFGGSMVYEHGMAVEMQPSKSKARGEERRRAA